MATETRSRSVPMMDPERTARDFGALAQGYKKFMSYTPPALMYRGITGALDAVAPSPGAVGQNTMAGWKSPMMEAPYEADVAEDPVMAQEAEPTGGTLDYPANMRPVPPEGWSLVQQRAEQVKKAPAAAKKKAAKIIKQVPDINISQVFNTALERFKPKDAEMPSLDLDDDEKALLLLDLGTRMMAISGRPGAQLGPGIGEAAQGTLGVYRDVKQGKKQDRRQAMLDQNNEVDRAERRAMQATNLELQQHRLGLETQERAERRAGRGTLVQGRDGKTYNYDAVTKEFTEIDAPEGVSVNGDRRQYEFEVRRDAYLAVHPGDHEGALQFAGGQKPMSRGEALKAAYAALDKMYEFDRPDPATYKQEADALASEFMGQGPAPAGGGWKVQPSEAAIKHLRANPKLAPQFKEKYGRLPDGFQG